MPEPRRPGAIVGDPAEVRKHRQPLLNLATADQHRGFVNDGLVESGSSASRLIDHIRGDALTNEIWRPALAAIGRGFQSSARVGRPMHHDYRRHLFLAGGYL